MRRSSPGFILLLAFAIPALPLLFIGHFVVAQFFWNPVALFLWWLLGMAALFAGGFLAGRLALRESSQFATSGAARTAGAVYAAIMLALTVLIAVLEAFEIWPLARIFMFMRSATVPASTLAWGLGINSPLGFIMLSLPMIALQGATLTVAALAAVQRGASGQAIGPLTALGRHSPSHQSQPRREPGLAIIMSIFVPFAGHIYAGRMIRAGLGLLAWGLLNVIGVTLLMEGDLEHALPFLLTAACLWLASLFTAGGSVKNENRQNGHSG